LQPFNSFCIVWIEVFYNQEEYFIIKDPIG